MSLSPPALPSCPLFVEEDGDEEELLYLRPEETCCTCLWPLALVTIVRLLIVDRIVLAAPCTGPTREVEPIRWSTMALIESQCAKDLDRCVWRRAMD